MKTHQEIVTWVKSQLEERGMAMVELERAANVSRKTLYRHLNSDGNYDTNKLPDIVAALGYELKCGYELTRVPGKRYELTLRGGGEMYKGKTVPVHSIADGITEAQRNADKEIRELQYSIYEPSTGAHHSGTVRPRNAKNVGRIEELGL